MANVLQMDANNGGGGFADYEFASPPQTGWFSVDIAFSQDFLDSIQAYGFDDPLLLVGGGGDGTDVEGPNAFYAAGQPCFQDDYSVVTFGGPLVALQFYRIKMHFDLTTTSYTFAMWKDGVSVGPIDTSTFTDIAQIAYAILQSQGIADVGHPASYVYFANLKIGSTEDGTEYLDETFATDLSAFTGGTSGATIITDPGIAPAVGGEGGGGVTLHPDGGRVQIAFDDGPLVADPTWTTIDDLDNLVARIDIETGKQTELDRTDTGTATIYLNDTTGLFDPLNASSPYFGKLDGKQIRIRLWNPVTLTFETQWRGTINDYGYVINPATNPDGSLIVANVQVDCVDIFDYLAGYELALGADGDVPPAGSEGTIFYEDTLGTVDDRIVQILTDADVPSARYVPFSGNVSLKETKYDPGDSALTALRDCADAEFPGLANIYVDRFGRFVFHGRRARFDPEGVIADGPVSTDTWDFHRWKLGDGNAIVGDSDYAQLRVLAYTHGRSDIVNYAIAWPKGLDEVDMPNQGFEDATSRGLYGKHALPPMSDLIINEGTTTGNSGAVECQKFAEFFVHYLKNPQERITQIMVKAISPDDPRAASTWDVLSKADISDIARVTVGYPNGTGLDMDNYIEGYTKRIRPLNPRHDYVEVEFNLTPTSWSMDPDGILAPAS